MKVCGCGQDVWPDLSGCYYCLKLKAGLIGWSSNGHKFSDREKFHIGLLPEWEPDTRSFPSARAAQLRREPNCAVCGRKATVADHVRPRSEGGADLDPANLQSLCEEHHRTKTTAEGTGG